MRHSHAIRCQRKEKIKQRWSLNERAPVVVSERGAKEEVHREKLSNDGNRRHQRGQPLA
jgi:hypothetical protein